MLPGAERRKSAMQCSSIRQDAKAEQSSHQGSTKKKKEDVEAHHENLYHKL